MSDKGMIAERICDAGILDFESLLRNRSNLDLISSLFNLVTISSISLKDKEAMAERIMPIESPPPRYIVSLSAKERVKVVKISTFSLKSYEDKEAMAESVLPIQ
ncbi:MAG: hypothetical protein H8D54_03860, partial [Candidatus Omnitrophica bacterium]|nr:hypothetical protein [Candidatus Omnitrophota bacterium]